MYIKMIRKNGCYFPRKSGGGLSVETRDKEAKDMSSPAAVNIDLGTGTNILSQNPFSKAAGNQPAVAYGESLKGLEKINFRSGKGRPKKRIEMDLF
jgi:hypothetical protein